MGLIMDQIIMSTIGGMLIGLSASIMLLGNGKITGISGMLASFVSPTKSPHLLEKLYFIIGLIIGGSILKNYFPSNYDFALDQPLYLIAVAGILVGFGTRLGSGCTSGHGICGISRLSLRSLIATITFMITGAISVYVFN